MDNFLNNKIVSLLKQHPEGGKKFFDALDFMIRSNFDIIKLFTSYIFDTIETPETKSLILTGAFGRVLMNNCKNWINNFGDYLLVNGDIRSGVDVQIDKFPNYGRLVFVDDSIYSGNTRSRIFKELNYQSNGNYIITDTFVVYDGSKLPNIKCMFKYYDK